MSFKSKKTDIASNFLILFIYYLKDKMLTEIGI